MSANPLLFTLPEPPIPEGIDLRCCDVAEVLAEVRGARLVIADPAWDEYEQSPGVADPSRSYPTLSLDDIADHLDATAACAAPGARLAVWHCWPLLVEGITAVMRPGYDGPWRRILRPEGWRPPVTGGAWTKEGQKIGVGFHWLGHSEPVLIYRKPGSMVTDRSEVVRNAHVSPPEEHSAKPVDWMRGWLRRWTSPGDTVLDLYAGLGSAARACRAEGRKYVGSEIDPERHRRARGLLATWRHDA